MIEKVIITKENRDLLDFVDPNKFGYFRNEEGLGHIIKENILMGYDVHSKLNMKYPFFGIIMRDINVKLKIEKRNELIDEIIKQDT